MPTIKKLNTLKINKLTEAQLAAATVSEDELYLVTDADNPVTVKTDETLTGNGLAATPLSVSPALSAVSVQTTLDSGLPFLDESGSQMWRMGPGKTLYAAYVGTGNTVGIIGGEGATLDAVYAAKLCKDSTELSVRDGKTGDIAITSELPEAKTGTAGQVYTKTDTGAEWKNIKEGLPQVSTITDFSEPVAEDLNKLVLYIGPTVDADEVSIQKIFDSKIINGHVFGVIEQTIVISETESQTFYMWKDVYENLPAVSDETNNKILSNDGLNITWVDVPSTTEIIMREL